MTIKQQGGIFGRNPTFNDVDATDVTSSTITATTSVSTPVETISGNTPSVAFSSNSAGMLFSGGTDATKYSGIVFRGANSWNTFLGRIPDGAADPLVIGNDAISAFGAICTFGANDVTINRGNLVIGTSGQGIDFSATSDASGSTSELFDDYEEGTWTPEIKVDNTGAAIGVIPYEATYTKVGRLVFVEFRVGRNDASALSGNVTWNLPFASGNATYFPSGSFWNDNTGVSGFVNVNNYANAICNGRTEAGSLLTFADYANGQSLVVSLVYQST